MYFNRLITFFVSASAIIEFGARSVPLSAEAVTFDPARFGFNITQNNTIERRWNWGPAKEGLAPELKGPGNALFNWIDCPGHKEWPHQHKIWHGPGPYPEIPFNLPTDRFGHPIKYPVDEIGRSMPGPLKDPELDPPQCCRPTWGCFMLVVAESKHRRTWQEFQKEDKFNFNKLQCCLWDYTLTCSNPQNGPDWHWNPPPMCSNNPW